ncbi:MAG: protein kinase [Pirellulaceae bacterium]|nr:protein kinase [Pirellulaceae bacterium]
MMTDKDPCPETARVQVMVEGTLSEEDHGAMALHLENCEPCQERFEQLMREVDCFSEVARELGGELRTKDTALEQVIQALHAKGTGPKDGGELSDEATDGEPASSEDLSLDSLDPSDDPDHLGRLGPYEVIEVVGRGGMGVVLKGHDHRLNRVVAIKVLHPRLAINATARKRFRRESRAAAAVSHDHVATIHAVEEVDGLPILVMEYVEGVSLQQRIKENGPLMLEEILRVGMQAASGLAAAHAQGIIHRDVKPSNILLENGVERVKLTDFGLARAVDDVHLTKSGVLAGTPEYMSPEQAHAEPVDGRSDLFSLGCVLYACCTGRSPFRADSTMAALRRVCEDTPRLIREINPDIPDWLVEIIDRLLTKDRDQRFESASDVAELLGGHLAHLQHPTDVPQPARLKPPAAAGPSRPNRFLRRRWIAGAAAALVVLVAGMGVTEGTGLTRVVATVIELRTPQGTLIIETNDPDIEIAISGDGEEVIFTGAGVRKITVPIGVLFEVKGKKDGNTVFREVVRITRNGKRVTTVRVAPPEPEEPTSWAPRSRITTSLPNGMVIHEPVNVGPIVNSRFDDTAPAISADGLTLLFNSDRPGGEGDSDLWMCTRASVGESFGRPVNLGLTVNSSSRDVSPALSTDGLTLLFSSRRPGGQGTNDLWMCRRASVGESFGRPVNLGPTVNSSSGDYRATLSADGLTLLFCSDRLGGVMRADLWMCTRASVGESFGRPVNLGPTVNSNFRDGGPTLSTDGLTLLFDSDRPRGQGGRDLWWARIEHGEIPSTEKLPPTDPLLNPKNGHYYQRIDVPMSWHEAKEYCESLEGHLATVTSSEENVFVYENFGTDHVCWLGATDEAEEGTWQWVTGEPFEYTNWFRGQPSGGVEHYLALGNTRSVIKDGKSYFYRFGARWNDHGEKGRYYGEAIAFPVCEWPALPRTNAAQPHPPVPTEPPDTKEPPDPVIPPGDLTVNSSNDVDPFGLAEKEGWQRVLRRHRQEVDGGTDNHWRHYKLLSLLAYLGDAEVYQEYCNDHLDRFKDSPQWYRQRNEAAGTYAARSAHAALLLPGIELARIEPLMDFSESTVYRSHFVRAMYEYRTGRFDSAVQHFEVSRKFYGRGGAEYIEALHTQSLYWLAMTHHKLGNGDEATKAYQNAENRFRQSTVPATPDVDGVRYWHDWLQAAVIRREAHAVLGLKAEVEQLEE